MKIFKKIFGGTEMSWKLLLIYSVITGAAVGLLNCVPFLEGTSLTAPAVSFEYWFVAAIFVIVNCKNSKEAMLKTFIFFLISQPLIYLVEVPFKEAGWGLFQYYKNWALITLLTIPGAWIAYQIKKDNVLSAVILSVATGYLCGTGIGAIKEVINEFPYGILTIVFCFAFAFILIQTILQKKNTRIIGWVCSVVIAIIFVVVIAITGSSHSTGTVIDSSHQWEIVSTDTDAKLEENYLMVSTKKDGTYHVVLKNENGETVEYIAVFDNGSMTISESGSETEAVE